MTTPRRVLAFNFGSSSLRFRLFGMPAEEVLDEGMIERIDSGSGYRNAVDSVLDRLADAKIDAIGHRVVHGGEHPHAEVVDRVLLDDLESWSALAPLHNPPAIAGIRAVLRRLPQIPNVAVFDTSFHDSMPPHARAYAIDAALARQHSVRRYGFHGISYEYVSKETARVLRRDPRDLRMIVLHLGSGASVAAIAGGRSIDTSMGFTPLEGLVMGTRSGDLDPAIVTHLQRAAGMSPDQLDELLTSRSGLLGLAGHSDMRDVLEAEAAGSPDAELAVEVYLHRLRRYIGAYVVELGGLDALVFTGGVGENSHVIRARAVERLGFLGINVDPDRNQSIADGPRIVSAPDGAVAVLVVPTDEEREIARQTVRAISGVTADGT